MLGWRSDQDLKENLLWAGLAGLHGVQDFASIALSAGDQISLSLLKILKDSRIKKEKEMITPME